MNRSALLVDDIAIGLSAGRARIKRISSGSRNLPPVSRPRACRTRDASRLAAIIAQATFNASKASIMIGHQQDFQRWFPRVLYIKLLRPPYPGPVPPLTLSLAMSPKNQLPFQMHFLSVTQAGDKRWQ
ncbi:hypothetical protein BaRGS_00001396 [Batillaria attramentaria]|uniref:Uncharacterized protein n=1 Tax=Batillaria attramentaria TaxID=370345 RepID=A0ABD0M724_9CAEN